MIAALALMACDDRPHGDSPRDGALTPEAPPPNDIATTQPAPTAPKTEPPKSPATKEKKAPARTEPVEDTGEERQARLDDHSAAATAFSQGSLTRMR